MPASFVLQGLAARAIELDDLKEAGAQFSYPQALSPPEWIAIKCFHRERRIAQAKLDSPTPEKQRKKKLQDQMMSLPPVRR